MYSFVIGGYATAAAAVGAATAWLLPLSFFPLWFFFSSLLLQIIIRAGVRVDDERITCVCPCARVCVDNAAMMCQSFLVRTYLLFCLYKTRALNLN